MLPLPSLQDAVRPHTLKALYKAAPIRVEEADQQPLYICTVDTGCPSKSSAQPHTQVGLTSEHTVAIITQVCPSVLLTSLVMLKDDGAEALFACRRINNATSMRLSFLIKFLQKICRPPSVRAEKSGYQCPYGCRKLETVY